MLLRDREEEMERVKLRERAGLRVRMREPGRGNEGEKDNKKTNVCQCKHACACQSIPLWLIWKGWFLARRTLEALTRLLLHSSASHKASICSNWPWIRSYWLEVSKINKHNMAVLCVHTSKILTRCSIEKDNATKWQLLQDEAQREHQCRLLESIFCFVFISKSIKVSSCNHWCECLRCWPSSVQRCLVYQHHGQVPPQRCRIWEPRGSQKSHTWRMRTKPHFSRITIKMNNNTSTMVF